ncbi:hypothetical protein ACPTIX_14580, partial [Enterococcus faecalis]|uniref:hypothetical protein n=1 Tax=Enterococcus faecalis TaxID=1351 RepID=UPI003CC654FD
MYRFALAIVFGNIGIGSGRSPPHFWLIFSISCSKRFKPAISFSPSVGILFCNYCGCSKFTCA